MLSISMTRLEGVQVVRASPVADDRGFFERIFCRNELAAILGPRFIVQANHSCTRKVGAIRGLHYQLPPHAEMKMVRCLAGRVFDVALDLRQGSPTFMSWHAEELSAANHAMLVIPEGCAHGFQVLEPDSELLYFHTAAYAPGSEAAVKFDDPRAAVAWPLPAEDLSARDTGHPWLSESFEGIAI